MAFIFSAKDFSKLTLKELHEIFRVRCQVFTVEQKILCIDPDDTDFTSVHCFLTDDTTKKMVAYARVYFEKSDDTTLHIGRVLTVEHGRGLGKILMEKILDYAEKNFRFEKFFLHAQSYATGFYEKVGFEICSEEFLEENIPHKAMQKFLKKK